MITPSQHTQAVVASNICRCSSSTDWPTDTLAAIEQFSHIRTGMTLEHSEPLCLLSHCRFKHNTRYQHDFALCSSSPFSHRCWRSSLPVMCTPWCVRLIWKPCPNKLCTTLSASNIPQVFVSDTGRRSRVSARPAERKEHLCSCWCETNGRAIPSELFHAFHRSSTLMNWSSPWKLLCLALGSW